MLKRAVEAGLAWGLGPWLEQRSRTSVAVLAYHNVVPEGGAPGADRSLHLPRTDFARQLDVLVESHRVVPLAEVLESWDNGEGDEGRPRAAITFDDAYRGAMTAGLDELASRGLPATVFVAPGELGGDGFWWDRLSLDTAEESRARSGTKGARAGASSDAPSREALLTEMAGRGRQILARAEREGWPRLEPPEHARPVRPDEIGKSAVRDGITFGAHSWSHTNLTRLDPNERMKELERPLAWLRERLDEAAVPVLAYPYGRCNDEVARAAQEAGYRAAFRTSGGRLGPESADCFALPRINVPAGVSADGFRLRVLGLLS